MGDAPRDANHVPTLLLESSTNAGVVLSAKGDQVTGRLLVDLAGGTVTSVSVVTANGVSGSVANPTTTPAITLTLGAITPTSINKVTITAPATASTLTIAEGKTLTASNSITLAGTDGKGIDIGAATNGKILIGDGSNFVSSAYTFASPGTSGNVLTSDGTNWTSAAAAGGGAKAASGTFTGNDATNRGIAHGLGVTPKFVFLLDANSGGSLIFRIFGSNPTVWYKEQSAVQITVTTMDATNFYVSGVANTGPDTIYWFATG